MLSPLLSCLLRWWPLTRRILAQDLTAASVGANTSYMGCAGHPSWLGHAKAAELSKPIVQKKMGW